MVPAVAPSEQIEIVVDLMRNAERPLLIAGSAAAYAKSSEAFQSLIETTRLPLMTEGDARGFVSDDHPYCMGFYDSALNQAARLIRQADLVVLFGRKQDLIMGYAFPPTIAADAKVVQIDPSAAEIGRNRGVDVGIVGDINAIVGQLAKEASKHTWNDLPWLDDLRVEREAHRQRLEDLAVAESPMHATYVHKSLEQHLGPEDCLTFDGGDFCHWGRATLSARAPKRWFYVPPLGMLGSSLPTALAAKIAYPDKRVIAFSGDGAFGFNGMELDTAVRHNLPVVMIVGNDSAWGIDRNIQIGVYGKPVATDLLPTRYDLVARGLGAHGEFIEHPDELPSAIERCFKLERPALINVQIQRQVSPRGQSAINRWKSHMAESHH
jgi:acetolactate synthase-1/2/3 large subunit